MVRECTQIDVHPRQAYSGDLVFTALSGSHQDAIKKCLDIYEEGTPWEIAYLPIDPRISGVPHQDVIRVNSQPKGGVAYAANKFAPVAALAADRVQSGRAKSGSRIPARSVHQIWTLFNNHYLDNAKALSLEDFTIAKHEGRETFAAKLNYMGEMIAINGEGDGVLDAFVEALKDAIKLILKSWSMVSTRWVRALMPRQWHSHSDSMRRAEVQWCRHQ